MQKPTSRREELSQAGSWKRGVNLSRVHGSCSVKRMRALRCRGSDRDNGRTRPISGRSDDSPVVVRRLRALVLAPGFAATQHAIAPGTTAATADVELKAQRWVPTKVRLEDQAGRPVAGDGANLLRRPVWLVAGQDRRYGMRLDLDGTRNGNPPVGHT